MNFKEKGKESEWKYLFLISSVDVSLPFTFKGPNQDINSIWADYNFNLCWCAVYFSPSISLFSLLLDSQLFGMSTLFALYSLKTCKTV